MSEEWVGCYCCGIEAATDERDSFEDGFGPLCASCHDAIELYKEHTRHLEANTNLSEQVVELRKMLTSIRDIAIFTGEHKLVIKINKMLETGKYEELPLEAEDG